MAPFIHKIVGSRFGVLIIIVLLILVQFASSVLYVRADLTREKRYTLSPATEMLIKKLDEPLLIEVFLKGNFPAGFQKLATGTNEFLSILKDKNIANVQYRFVSPAEKINSDTDKRYADTLQALGAMPINLTVQSDDGQKHNYIFPTAVVHYRGRMQLVQLYTGSSRLISQTEINESEALLEYRFVSAINKLVTAEKPVVSYALGNGQPENYTTYSLRNIIQSNYQFFTFNIKSQPIIPKEIKVLVMVKPSISFTEEEKLKLDQYVMNGGKLLCFIDHLYAEPDSLAAGNGKTIAYDRNLNLTDLFFKYGARINADLMMDLQCEAIPFIVGGSGENPQQEFLRWNYYPLLKPGSSHTIVRNLGPVGARFVGSMDTIKTDDVKKTVLLSSSPSSRAISTPAIISLNENRNAPDDALFRSNNIPVAMLLEGRFTSLFKNRLPRPLQDSLATYNSPFKPQSEKNKMIIVADGDMPLNEALPDSGPLPMGWNKYTYYEYESKTPNSRYFIPVANAQFFQSCLEYLIENESVIETRNKNIVLRMLDSKKVKAQKSMWQFINIIAPVFLIILFGLIYRQIRMRKYVV